MSAGQMTTSAVGIISDTHFWQRSQPVITADGAIQLQAWSDEILDALLADLAAARLDVVIHLGDLSCGGGSYHMAPQEFVTAMHHIHRRLHSLGIPIVALPGNHDLRPNSGDLSEFCLLWQAEPGVGKTVDLPQARLILLNAMGHTAEQIAAATDGDPVYGWVSATELQRLDTELAAADRRPVLLFTHQLLLPWTGAQPWRDYYGILNAGAVMEILERRGGVCAVFQGHAHRLNMQKRSLGRHTPCLFGILPALVEYPVAWTHLTLSASEGHFLLRRLPIEEIAAVSATSGSGQYWRAGHRRWWSFHFPLC